MPESKGRKNAQRRGEREFNDKPLPAKRRTDDPVDEPEADQAPALSAEREARVRRNVLGEGGAWVAPTFVTLGLLGVLWLVLYYVASPYIPGMAQLGVWNMVIGMGLMGASFLVATQWK